MHTKKYISPTLNVDNVIFELVDDKLCVLLHKRRDEPFVGLWTLPGGHNPAGETTHEAMARVLREKVGLDVAELRFIDQLYTFDTVARDPRGHAVSVTYMGVGRELTAVLPGQKEQPKFFPVHKLPDLAFDHADIVTYAHERLKRKLSYTNAIFALLPKKFTLSQLQAAYEAVLEKKLDKRNFVKKFMSLDLIEPTEELFREGAHRPARLFVFKQKGLQVLTRRFD